MKALIITAILAFNLVVSGMIVGLITWAFFKFVV